MFSIDYDIRIGSWELGLLQSVEIHKSVDLLAQTAVVVLPGVVYNRALKHEGCISVGDPVTIKIGYDGELREEFTGFVQRVDTDDDSITVNCEDGMFLTRKPVRDRALKDATVSQIAQYCLSEIGLKKLDCTYDLTFGKFVIKSLNAFDVFRKLKEDTGAQIYMVGQTLHVHRPYIAKGGRVAYDFGVNVESSDLKYRSADDRRFEVEVEGIGLDGQHKKVMVGVAGGEKRTVKVPNALSDAELKKRGEAELAYLVYDGYEGSIKTWLVPYVEPTWSARISDADYEYKEGTYYVNAVTTTVSDQGGVRTVELGKKVS